VETFSYLRRPETYAGGAVGIANPVTTEFDVCRTSLLPGALKTLGANKQAELPVPLFELSDVVLLAGMHLIVKQYCSVSEGPEAFASDKRAGIAF
jgi:phenylalanyl-tRNA synthetase beta subunit